MQARRHEKFAKKNCHGLQMETKNKFQKVLEAFQNYCSPRKNIIYERYIFWSLQQEGGESIDAYLMRLKVKIDSCEYSKEGWHTAV